MSKKTKNYADLENARVFHNPKTDLIEITGKYVDGGNFSVVLTKGAKSDTKVRTELSIKDSPLVEEPQEFTRYLPSSAEVSYDSNFNSDVYRDGKIWRHINNKYSVFYLPLVEDEKPSLFPLAMDQDSRPVLVDLHGGEKKNLFISARPGSGGAMSLYNLAFHVLRFMPETTLISNDPDIIHLYKKSETVDANNAFHLKGLYLLEHLRELHHKMLYSKHGATGANEVILIENFESFIHNEIATSPSSRTDKAVRAETMDLILEISKIERSEFKVNFVFFASKITANMNAFINTCHTFTVFGRGSTPVAETEQRKRIFGRDLHELETVKPGDGFIQDEDVYKEGDFFASFTNPEVVELFAVPNPKAQKR